MNSTETFSELWRHKRYASAVVSARVPKCDREDVLQLVAERLWKCDYDPARSKPRTFVTLVSRRVVTDYLRCRYRQSCFQSRYVPIEAYAGDVPEHFEIPERISQQEREILQLVCGWGRTYRIASECLGVPLGTVKSLMHRMLSRFQEVEP